MADNMIRIAGRGTDGTAKPIATDNNGNVGVRVVDDINTIKTAPVTAIKTVTETVSEIFAGASAKANRRTLIIKNEDTVLRFRVGENKVGLQQSGFPVEPNAVIEFNFEPNTAVPIYAVSEGVALSIAIMEV